ncbi:MAG: site-2 protease family protein [Spirochaetia bacterium]|nr:site-2 protease family protein [Spirochaetota bacterium]MCX8096037.1 site-2 protease family protein [Spirochaetota bacterium]MDW8111832.1 site-2 protease family protein [Spirochaetia bacterium]
MEYILTAVAIFILIISVVIHEYAHGRVSYAFGDTTAKDEGRLTLNPIKHLDPVGSIFLPIFLVVLNTGFIIGWARPVPINPDNYHNKRLGWIATAIAGPVSNYSLMLISMVLILLIGHNTEGAMWLFIFKVILWYILAINFVLGSFNLIPLPPLDGFWILLNLLPSSLRDKISSIVISKYYPLFIIITVVLALLISRYTIIPVMNAMEEWLKVFPR